MKTSRKISFHSIQLTVTVVFVIYKTHDVYEIKIENFRPENERISLELQLAFQLTPF